jgi:hypothetical protein
LRGQNRILNEKTVGSLSAPLKMRFVIPPAEKNDH